MSRLAKRDEGAPTPRSVALRDWVLVCVPLVVYVVVFFAYPPRGPVNTDEAAYMGQARAFAQGRFELEGLDPFTCRPHPRHASPYPAGVSALQTLFIRLGGWQSAATLSPLCLVIAVVVLGLWLRAQGHSPLFALLLITFPPMIVAGRTALSDVPTTALVTLATALFFSGSAQMPVLWLGAGLLGGLSLMMRDVAAIYFVGYFSGPLLRLERGAWLIVVGVALGVAATGLSALTIRGEVMGWRMSYGFSFSSFLLQAPLYLLVLLATVPGGPLATFFYRGPRRAEVVATFLIVWVFFSAYKFAGWESGGWKQLVLGPRYFMPIVPTLVLAIADVATRSVLARSGGALPSAVAVPLAVIVSMAAFAVHPALHAWGESQWRIGEALYAKTPERSAIITNDSETLRFVNEAIGLRAFSNRVTPELLATYTPGPEKDRSALPDAIPGILAACGNATIALLDRTNSDLLRRETAINAEFVAAAERLCRLEPIADLQTTPTDRLRMWRVGPCSAPR